MKIVVTRSGGFGGLTRTWSLEVSRTEAEERWLPLAEAQGGDQAGIDDQADVGTGNQTGADARAGGQAPRAAATGSVQRDRFTYRIEIGYTEVQFPESELDDPWRELVDRARAATSARQTSPAKASDEGAGGNPDPRSSPELL